MSSMTKGFQIFIRNLRSTTLVMQVSPSSSIQEVKNYIQTYEGIPFEIQRLVFQGRELNNQCSIQETQIQKSDTLDLRLALKGGGNQKSLCNLEKKYEYNAHHRAAVSLAITIDNKHIVSGSIDGVVSVFDMQTRDLTSTRAHTAELAGLAVTKDKRFIISSCYILQKSLKIFEFEKLTCIKEFTDTFATSLEVTKDDRHFVCGTSDGCVKVFSLTKLNCVYTFKDVLQDPITSVIVRGNFVVCGTLTMKILSLAQRKCIKVFQHTGKPTKKLVAVSQNGKYLAQTGYDRCIKVFCFFGGKCIQRIRKADKHLIESIAISKNNRFIIIVNSKSVIKFFGLNDGRCVLVFSKEATPHADFPLLRVTPDSQNIVMSNWKGEIKVLAVNASNKAPRPHNAIVNVVYGLNRT